MSNNPRDTQFSGFAKAVLQEIDDAIGNGAKRMARNGEIDEKAFALELGMILTRRAYDLVAHTLWHTAVLDLERLSIGECVERIPDMAELPEEKSDD